MFLLLNTVLGRPFGTLPAYTEVEAVIRANADRAKKLVVQDFKKSAFFHRLISNGQVLDVYDVKEVPVYLGTPVMGKWMGASDQLPDHASSALAMSAWTNRYIVVPSGWNVMQVWENKGNANALYDMMDFAGMESAIAMNRALSSAAFSGTGTKQPDGLARLFEKLAPASQVNVIGNIDKSAKAWWRNQYLQLTQNFGFVAPGTRFPAGILALLDLIELCTVSTLIPSDIITTKNIWKMIRRGLLEMTSGYHLTSDKLMSEFGLASFMFDGHVVSHDYSCQADTVYCLHVTDKFDSSRTVGQDDPSKYDLDLEKVSTDSIFELNGNLTIIRNPNVNMIPIEARAPYRSLTQTSWMANSFNLGVRRMSDHGVAGSDNGSRWSTWS